MLQNVKKTHEKQEKKREKRRKSLQPQLLAKNIYIHFFFNLFFWLPRTLPKANSCPAGNEGRLLSCSLSLVSFGRSFWGNATVLLSVLHVALESRRQLVTSRMWRRGGSHCHTRDAPPVSRWARIGYFLTISQIACGPLNEIRQRVFKSTLKWQMRTLTNL